MPTQHNSISTTTVTDKKQNEIYGTPKNSDLNKAVNDALKGGTRNPMVFNKWGNYAGNRRYDFTSCISAGPSYPTSSSTSCKDKYGGEENVSTEVTTQPECCGTCTAPPLTLEAGSEKWKDKKTPSTVTCSQNIPYTAIYTLSPGQPAIANGTAPATKVFKGVITGSVANEKNVIDWVRAKKFNSQQCTDCYC